MYLLLWGIKTAEKMISNDSASQYMIVERQCYVLCCSLSRGYWVYSDAHVRHLVVIYIKLYIHVSVIADCAHDVIISSIVLSLSVFC